MSCAAIIDDVKSDFFFPSVSARCDRSLLVLCHMIAKMASSPRPPFSETTPLDVQLRKRIRNVTPSWQLRALCLVCQSYALFMTTFVPIYCIYQSYKLPKSSLFSLTFAISMACYICFNLFSNWHYFRWRQQSGITESSIDYNVNILHHCPDCNLDVPDDSHHCPICNVCVWRRDHHCFFLGGCVGRSNLGHFLAFCFHASLGCGYASLLLFHYLRYEYHDLSSWADFKFYIVPFAFVQWLFGLVSTSEVVSIFLLSMAFGTFLGTMLSTMLHLYLVFLAKTSYEFVNRQQGRNSNCKSLQNFNRTLGKNWYLRILFPTFLCKGDGHTNNLDWKLMKLI